MSPIPTPAIGDVLNAATSVAAEVAAPSGGPINVQNVVDAGVDVGLDAAQKAIPPEKLQEMAIDLAKAKLDQMITFTLDYIRNVFKTNPFMAVLLGFAIAILWFVFWRFIGKLAAWYAWRVHRRRRYVKYLDEFGERFGIEWDTKHPVPEVAKEKQTREKKEAREQAIKARKLARRQAKARALRSEIEELFGSISKLDIIRDQDLKDSLLEKYCREDNPGIGRTILAHIKAFVYYSIFVIWIWKLYTTRAEDRTRLDRPQEVESKNSSGVQDKL